MGGGEGGYSFGIDLYSNNFETLGYEEGTENRLGNGHFVALDLYSNSLTEITDGTYYYNRQRIAGNFNNGEFLIFNNGKALYDENEIESGKVTVEKNGNIYKISFEGVDYTGETISGYYDGEVTKKEY